MHDLSLYLLEVLENSTRAGATRVDVELMVDHAADELRLAVDDDGRGLTATPEQTLDPFYTTKPGKKTGLGLSLLKADAQAAGGDLRIGPSPSLGGVRVEAFMQLEPRGPAPPRRCRHKHHRDGRHQSGGHLHRESGGRRVRSSSRPRSSPGGRDAAPATHGGARDLTGESAWARPKAPSKTGRDSESATRKKGSYGHDR